MVRPSSRQTQPRQERDSGLTAEDNEVVQQVGEVEEQGGDMVHRPGERTRRPWSWIPTNPSQDADTNWKGE